MAQGPAAVAAAVALFAAGAVAALRFNVLARRVSQAVASLLFYFSVPLIVSYKVYSVEAYTLVDYSLVVAASVLTAFVSAALLIPRLLRGEPPETVGAAVLAAGIHNAAFLPIPLMLLLYGDGGPAALYSAVMNVIIAVATPLVLGYYSPLYRASGRGIAGSIARSLATYPPLYGLIAGTVLRCASLPPLVVAHWGRLFVLASYTTLLSFFLVGEVLARSGVRLDRGVVVVAAWRLLVEPTAAVAAVEALGLRGLWRAGALIEAVMPPATMNLVVSMMYGLDYSLVARSIGVVTPLSLAAAVAVRLLIGG